MSFIYRKAASMLSKCCQGRGIKEILYEKDDPSKKKIHYLIYKTLEDLNILNDIYNLYLKKICKNKCLGLILLSVLVHRKKIDGGGIIKKEIKKKEKDILKYYEEYKGCFKYDEKLNDEMIKKYFIIYDEKYEDDNIHIDNTKCFENIQNKIDLQRESTLFNNDINKNRFENIINKLIKENIHIEIDDDVEYLYKINNKDVYKLINNIIYKENKIRIIDKTSCLVVQAANIKKGMIIVDVCSSPGSKAIFSLSLLKKKGYLICIEKDKKRCYTLLNELLKNKEYVGLYMNENFDDNQKITLNKTTFFHNEKENKKQNKDKNKSEYQNINIQKNVYYIQHINKELFIKIYNCDFFNLTSQDFSSFQNIDAVFIDPSCSSSGMPDFIYKSNMMNMYLHDNEDNLKKNKNKNKNKYNSNGNNNSNNNSNNNNNKYKLSTSYNNDNITSNNNTLDENKTYSINDDILKGNIPRVPTCFINKVKKLSEFQKNILSHAINIFKTAKVFIYSTCSFFEEENEQVIQYVLERYPNIKLLNAGKEKFLFRNGNYVFSNKCVRTFPLIHSCRGIFISKMSLGL
ncbi:S-adenosyl-L-methionine-dependent methyltransferase, putative [Plasmodium gaboni]|uniref:S-adenosyl-L-methionine-dependent methyltransferase, putative n=1 Tax=Plasmodium gaboni TaxID=647221 RepID=A0ABY1UN11_9APIC|nr:S-adenosyl-L-methionine-dependent methyltransferase, putative [Plasmodium gaboni]